MKDWIEKLQQALRSEWSHARQEHAQLRQLSQSEQQALGLVWPILRLTESSPLYGQQTELWLRTLGPELHGGLQSGDLVRIAPSIHSEGIPATVANVETRTATLVTKADELPPWLGQSDLVVSLDFDSRTYRNFLDGLEKCSEDPTNPLMEALMAGTDSANDSPERPGLYSFEALDDSQAAAARRAMRAQHLALIHGPPGTGKTHTICAILSELCLEKGRPLGLADSNAAVDHLTRSLIARGLDPLRLGSRYRIAPDVFQYSLHGRMAQHPNQAVLVQLEKEIRRSKGREKGQLVRESRRIRREIRMEIIQNAPLLTCTLGSFGRFVGDLDDLHTAVVDEATQAIEPAIWSVVPHLKRLVIVGDPQQLGPVVTQPGNLLERSLMNRLIDRGMEAPMLSVQRRMSDAIMALVKDRYGPDYRAHESVSMQHFELQGLLESAQVLWIDTAGYGAEEAKDSVSHSLYNHCEVRLVEQVVKSLFEQGIPEADIGVIAPYSAQVSRIAAAIPEVEVATVNAYQGREKPVIVCSFVRSNLDGDLGFVKDVRRLTVAASRAQSLWIGVGDSATLAYDSSFSALFEVIQSVGIWQTVWEWLFDEED